jgi:hypothetical protein
MRAFSFQFLSHNSFDSFDCIEARFCFISSIAAFVFVHEISDIPFLEGNAELADSGTGNMATSQSAIEHVILF